MLSQNNIISRFSGTRIISIFAATSVVCAITGLAFLGSASARQLAAAARSFLTSPFEVSHPVVDLKRLYTAVAGEPTLSDSSYTVAVAPDNTITGHISWYGPGFHGRRTANGEIFNKNLMTCAHKSMPFGTLVRVFDKQSGRSVLVRVNDRGPYAGARVLDISEEAARQISLFGRGTTSAELQFFPPSVNRTISFDNNWRAVKLHGFTVLTAETPSFEKATVLAQELRNQGPDQQVYLTQTRIVGTTIYQVSVGLFDSKASASSMQTGLANKYASSRVVKFSSASDTAVTSASAQTGAQ